MALEMLDEVATPEGNATVVGLPEFDLVEVRYPGTRRLKIWPLDQVMEIAAPEAVASYEQAISEGRNPTVPEEAVPRHSLDTPNEILIRGVRVDEHGNPVSPRTGRKLTGVARERALKKLQAQG